MNKQCAVGVAAILVLSLSSCGLKDAVQDSVINTISGGTASLSDVKPSTSAKATEKSKDDGGGLLGGLLGGILGGDSNDAGGLLEGLLGGDESGLLEGMLGEGSGSSGSDSATGNSNSSGGSDNGFGTVKLSKATDKWPSGVYDAYGVPEFKAGKVSFTYPEDESGAVYMQCTREDMLAYVDALLAKGFRISDIDYECMQERTWESFEIYFPTPGGEFSIDGYFTYENEGKGNTEYGWQEDEEEDFEFTFNFRMYIAQRGKPEGWTKKGLLEKIGISDDVIMVPDASKVVGSVDTLFMTEDPLYYMFEVDFHFDYNLTIEYIRAYSVKLAEAFIKASDDGQILELFTQSPIDPSAKLDTGIPSFLYNYGGKMHMVMISGESGFGQGITIVVQQVQDK